MTEPIRISARVFATLPDAWLKPEPSPFSRDLSERRTLDSFLEGPSFDRDGNLYLVDVAHGRIFRVSPAADWSLVAEYRGSPNGLKIHKDGRLFVADRENGIVIIDPISGKVTSYIAPDRLAGYRGLNDLFFASNGDLYFTDQGDTGLHDARGQLWRMSSSGRLDCLLSSVPSPNGLVMNADESVLYLAVTRAQAVWQVPLRRDGTIHRVGIFCRTAGGAGPDGLALDNDGNLAVALVGRGAVELWSPLGEKRCVVEAGSETRATTNVAYGGPGNRTLFVTNSLANNVLMAELPVAGKTMFSHMPSVQAPNREGK